jgi:methyltransferase (TIGR00027 family)
MAYRLRPLIFAAELVVTLVPVSWAVEPGLPSRTAIGAAVGRAIGAKNPIPEFRNPDYLAIRLLGPSERALITDFPAEVLDLDFETAMKRYPNPSFVTAMFIRTKYFDRVLTEALDRKVAQAVVLGAGLDSRGYRFKDRLRGVKFFEVDYGPTQEHKKGRVQEIFGHLPEQVRYVPMDFTKDDLLTELQKAGYREDQATIFLWEAVVFYLPETAVKSTLHFVRDHAAPGSTIAFDYLLSRHPWVNNPATPHARAGEPVIFGFPDPGAADFVRREGLDVVEDIRSLDPNTPEGVLLRRKNCNLPPRPQESALFGRCIARVPDKPSRPQ